MTTTAADPGGSGTVPPTRTALCCVGAAVASGLGVSVWLATLPVVDSLWVALPLLLFPMAFGAAPWHVFRRVCFFAGGLLIPLAVLGVFLCWFLLLPAAGFLFLAGGLARPSTELPGTPDAGPPDGLLLALLAGILVDGGLSAVWWTENSHDGNVMLIVVWTVWPGLTLLLIPFWSRTRRRLRTVCNSLAAVLPLFAIGGITLGWAPLIFATPPLLAVSGCTSRARRRRQWSVALATVLILLTTVLWLRALSQRDTITT